MNSDDHLSNKLLLDRVDTADFSFQLLMRQLRLQRMQEKVLQAQFQSLRLPIARYEEIDPDGERVQLLGEDDEDFLEDAVEEEQELNVMNSGDESGDEMIRTVFPPSEIVELIANSLANSENNIRQAKNPSKKKIECIWKHPHTSLLKLATIIITVSIGV
ncbi:unnamed protein product [Nippostrongylus brasiliensis]|uniref:Uncharacterized protein n=1 Tax=Nippostrongylus brasiliensis TaxID=27835 RepID=A0A0N4YTQ2_NIPBR|nr:unnamed protein product [Nippostrongylus brasiliensis]